jgi:hypothetical protein
MSELGENPKLGYLTYAEISAFVDEANKKRQWVMLGTDEEDQVDDDVTPDISIQKGKTATEAEEEHHRHHGRAYVAIELAPPRWTEKEAFEEEKKKTDEFVAGLKENKGWTFPAFRPGAPYGFDLSYREAAIVSLSCFLFIWKFC